MNTRQYYYLATIAEFGNLTYAAKALHISPSALSKFLAECEQTFGFPLFLRYSRRLYPTAVGRYVVECAQKILDEQNRMLLTMKDVTGGNRDRIRLATAPNRGAMIFSKIYNQFSRRYPGISLHLTELYAKEQPGAIARGRIDLALGAGADSTDITDVPIAYEELLVSLPVSHPLSGQEKIRLADLKDTPFVLQGSQHSIRILAEHLFQEAGFQPVVAFESSDVLLADSMMHQAVGVGLVSKAHVFPCAELVYRPLDPPVYQTLHLRYPLGHNLTEPERYLAGLLARERLADPRYQAIDDPQVHALLHAADSPDEQRKDNSAAHFQMGTALQNVQEINLDSKVLEYLIAIADEQGLSRAADRCFLAQPALSRHLRSVEEMVGIAGQATPKVTLGSNISFRYHDWYLSLQMNGAFGHKIFNGTGLAYTNMSSFPDYNVLKGAPEKNIVDQNVSDYWLENGDYLNFEYLTLGYDIPIKKGVIQSLRVSASVNNLATITSYSGLTPIINSYVVNSTMGIDDKRTYPLYRTFSLGLSVQF